MKGLVYVILLLDQDVCECNIHEYFALCLARVLPQRVNSSPVHFGKTRSFKLLIDYFLKSILTCLVDRSHVMVFRSRENNPFS